MPIYLAVVAAMELEAQSGVPFFTRMNRPLCPWAPIVLDVNRVHARNKSSEATLPEHGFGLVKLFSFRHLHPIGMVPVNKPWFPL